MTDEIAIKEFQRFCLVADVPENGKKGGRVNGLPILVCHNQGKYFAIAATCSHQARLLNAGRVRGGKITCPLHGAQFDLATGKALCLPASKPIATYELRIVDEWIEVCV